MNLKFVSIDIETTALDPAQGQILEIGAVFHSYPGIDVSELPTFHALIKSDRIYGDLAAIVMNADLLREIKNGISISDASAAFKEWIGQLKVDFNLEGNLYAAGKNFASFDGPWLHKHLFDPPKWKHRVLDLGSVALRSEDTEIPNLDECLKRCGLEKSVTHRALDDARDVIRCLRMIL